MRKTVVFTLMAAALLMVMGISVATAQDKTPIEFGKYVEGEITNKDYEFKYTFEGEKGQLVSVEMLPTPVPTTLILTSFCATAMVMFWLKMMTSVIHYHWLWWNCPLPKPTPFWQPATAARRVS